jgi:hypothetical protein
MGHIRLREVSEKLFLAGLGPFRVSLFLRTESSGRGQDEPLRTVICLIDVEWIESSGVGILLTDSSQVRGDCFVVPPPTAGDSSQ